MRNRNAIFFAISWLMSVCLLSIMGDVSTGGEITSRGNRQITFGASNFSPGAAADQIEKFYADIKVEKFAELGVTSFESYVRWSVMEPSPGEWDFAVYDKEIEILKKNGLKWVPFLIAGPSYTTPEWFKKSDKSVFYKCVEHGTESENQSIFNPALAPHVEEFIRRFAERYEASGMIESVLLGITGDFGEAIYPVSGGGWTGGYHQHGGFWCADKFAAAHFQKYLKEIYKNIESLDSAWGTAFRDFGEVKPFLKTDAPSPRAWLDFVEWYRVSMEQWADFWLKTTKKYFPNTPIYLCTGGDGVPEHGSRFSRQVKISAKYGAGVRITNEGSDYGMNFHLTRWVSSAGKFYNSFYGFEPASAVTPDGIVRRIYNVAASGAVQLFEYSGNVTGSDEATGNFRDNIGKFEISHPMMKTAVFIPETYLVLNRERWGLFFNELGMLRDLMDFDFVDEGMAADGALANYQILVMQQGNIVADEAAEKIQQWVKRGGIFAASGIENIKRLGGMPFFDGFTARAPAATRLDKLAHPYGEGYIVNFRPDLNYFILFRTVLKNLIYRTDLIDKKYVPMPEIDEFMDGIYTTLLSDGLLLLNVTDKEWEKEISIDKRVLERLNSLGVKTLPAEADIKIVLKPQEMKRVKFVDEKR
ncbi:MAG: alpha-amylase family protein [bacterium]